MATRYYSFAENEFYHLYNRGNSKQIIFRNESDYRRFVKLLYLANSAEGFKTRTHNDTDIFTVERGDPLVYIGAYCLMTNHFHVLLTPAVTNGISQFMLKLATAYVSYFNKKYERTGGLFEGSYRAKWADSDRYLKYLFSYVHLNPFRGKESNTKKFFSAQELLNYTHSSLPDYLGLERSEGKILTKEKFPQYFSNLQDQTRELVEWLDFEEII